MQKLREYRGVYAGLGTTCALLMSACTGGQLPVRTVEGSEESQAQSQQIEVEAHPPLVKTGIVGVPFELMLPSGSADDIEVIGAFEPQEADLELLGKTQVPSSGMPGPSVRALLEDGNAFAGVLEPPLSGGASSLADIPTTLGLVDPSGVFEPDEHLRDSIIELEGSNPDQLYFEPQDATSNGEWVVWREGSAGLADGMPTLDTDDWRIIGWNRASGTVLEIASGFLMHGDRFAPRGSWSAAPSTDGVDVYFEAMVPVNEVQGDMQATSTFTDEEGDNWVRVVATVPLASPGQVEVIGEGSMPVATETGPHWIQGNYDVVGRDGLLLSSPTPGWSVSRLATQGSTLVVVMTSMEEQTSWLLVWDLGEGRLTTAVDAMGLGSTVSIYDGSLAWGSGTETGEGGMYLWRQGESLPVLLGYAPGFAIPYVGGDVAAFPKVTQEGQIAWLFYRNV